MVTVRFINLEKETIVSKENITKHGRGDTRVDSRGRAAHAAHRLVRLLTHTIFRTTLDGGSSAFCLMESKSKVIN
jgi:hypothetical protein